MKRIALLLIAAMHVVYGYGQTGKVITAYRFYQDFNDTKDINSLNKAKDAIDLANDNADTKNEAKTQVYRGQIYLAIFDYNLRNETEKLISITDPNKKTLMGYQNTSSLELDTTYRAFAKARKLDEKGKFKTDIDPSIDRIAAHFENKAIADYNAKKFTESLPSFERAYEIKGIKDSTDLGYCALVAEKASNPEKAIMYYRKMIDNKQGRATSYSSLANVYLNKKTQNDTTTAKEILKQGRTVYPNDIALLITETNFFLAENKSEDAMKNLNIAITAKPADANLYIVRGNLYDNLANPKDATGNFTEQPKDFEDEIKRAEADYKKSIELKPDYFDALYSLGVLYVNHGVSINRQADKITDQKKYDAVNAKSIDEFNRAMPVLEKAFSLKPKDRNTMIALKQIYARLGLKDKLDDITEKLKK